MRAERLVRQARRFVPSAFLPILRRAYEMALEQLAGERLVAELPGGERLRLSGRYRGLTWNPDEYAAFQAVVRPGALVLDVGANVGAYTMLFATWAGASGRVFAFEPAPQPRAGLQRHLRLNGFANVETIAAAVSDREGAASFAIDPCGGASTLADAPRAGDVISVATTSVDAFCASRDLRPDVIKIDAEGSELEVLRGARDTLRSAGPEVFVEFHPSIWALRGLSRDDIERELRSQGLVPEALKPEFDVWSTEGVCVRLRRI